MNEEDIIRWKKTRDGIFTVKSAYNKFVESSFILHSTSNSVPKVVWKTLWKMEVPHRVKLFIWKCLKDIVQTNDKLCRFNSTISVSCGIYNHSMETLFHLLLECRHARQVWSTLNINVDGVAANCGSINEWIISWFSSELHNGIEMDNDWRITLMVACWAIWKERCEQVFQNKSVNHYTTVQGIQLHLQNFRLARKPKTSALTQTTSFAHTGINCFIVFVDASYDKLTNTSGSVMVLFSSTGTCDGVKGSYADGVIDSELTNTSGTGMVLFSSTGTCDGVKGSYADGVIDSEAAECMGIMEALSWLKALNIYEVHIFADAEVVVNAITKEVSQVRWENNNFIRDIKQLISFFKTVKSLM